MATQGTGKYLEEHGVPCRILKKIQEGRPNIYDAMVNGEIDLIINTPAGKQSKYDDSYLRKTAINKKIPYLTTMYAAKAAAKGIAAVIRGEHDELNLFRSTTPAFRMTEDRKNSMRMDKPFA